MTSLSRREQNESTSPFARMDRFFEEWMRLLPARRPFGLEWPAEEVIRVDEYRDGATEVIRAELPGVDPEKDVDVTVSDGVLRISAERRVEKQTEDKGYTRHELRYGSMSRTLPLPEGVAESEIRATYRDGILEIRVPIPERPQNEPRKVAITTG
jgi:HSP20 family protein